MLQLYFLKENCQRLMNVLTALEARDTPLACSVFNMMEDLRSYLLTGTTKEQFGEETDRLLAKLGQTERKKMVKSFHKVFQLSLNKLDLHLRNLPAYDYYKAVRIFHPRQLLSLSHDIDTYGTQIPALVNPSTELMEEWLIYTQLRLESLPSLAELPLFWANMQGRFPILTLIASDAIWMPVSSVDVERSFSQYKHLLNDRRESLTDDNTRRLMMLYFNGDIEHRLS